MSCIKSVLSELSSILFLISEIMVIQRNADFNEEAIKRAKTNVNMKHYSPIASDLKDTSNGVSPVIHNVTQGVHKDSRISLEQSSHSDSSRAQNRNGHGYLSTNKKAGDHNNGGDLLHTAIEHNYNLLKNKAKSSSTLTDINQKPQRPHLKKSNSALYKHDTNETGERIQNFIAPTRQKGSDYDDEDDMSIEENNGDSRHHEKEDTISPYSTTDNSFHALNSLLNLIAKSMSDSEQEESLPLDSNKHLGTSSDSQPSSTLDNKIATPGSGKFYQKISSMINKAQNSVNTLLPLSSYKESRRVYSDKPSTPEAADNHDQVIEGVFDSWASPLTDHEIQFQNYDSTAPEVEDFQNFFVESSKPSQHIDQVQKLGRIQQKIIDFKELYNTEGDNSAQLNLEFDSYNAKIQHDIIMNQYTSIRLRFGTKAVFGKGQVKTNTGVLGYVNRSNEFDKGHGCEINSSKWLLHLHEPVNDAESYIRNIWDSECKQFKRIDLDMDLPEEEPIRG